MDNAAIKCYAFWGLLKKGEKGRAYSILSREINNNELVQFSGPCFGEKLRVGDVMLKMATDKLWFPTKSSFGESELIQTVGIERISNLEIVPVKAEILDCCFRNWKDVVAVLINY